MIKGLLMGLLMASGMLVHRVLFGKNPKEVKDSRTILGYSILNMLWLFTLVGALFGGEILILQILCIILFIAYPTILTILGIKHRKNINQRDIYTDTHNDEPIVDIVSETVTEISPPKKHRKKESPVITKVSSFFLRYKKVFLVLSLVTSVLFIASLIAYNTIATYSWDLLRHYKETCEHSFDPYCTLFGCGLTSCSYCKGEIIVRSGYADPYTVEKYRFVSDVSYFLEGCLAVFLISAIVLAIVGLTALIIQYVHHRKNSSKAETLQDT